MTSKSIQNFAKEFGYTKGLQFAYNKTSRLITDEAPSSMYSLLGLSRDEYLIKGSVGNGKWADIPWIAIMHRGVTSSTQSGYYVALLFSRDLRHLFISLELGWTQFQERYGNKQGKIMIASFAERLGENIKGGQGDVFGRLNIGATTPRSKGYELANIVATDLDIFHLDDVSLASVIDKHLGYYENLRSTYGADLLYDTADPIVKPSADVESLKSKVKAKSVEVDKSRALLDLMSLVDAMPPEKRKVYTMQILRNKGFADFVKARAFYICEICGRKPFLKRDNRPYAEADHIEPLWGIGVDHPDNMRCLCALCHRVVTYGSDKEIQQLKRIL